jgi:hypothetical protein
MAGLGRSRRPSMTEYLVAPLEEPEWVVDAE